MMINGVSIDGLLDVIEDQGKLLVHSRVLAALIHGEVKWHGQEQAIEIKTERVSGVFHVGSPEVKLISGKSYIELGHFKKAFGGSVNWSAEGDALSISYRQGNK